MTEAEFIAYVFGSMFIAYWGGLAWGKYARILKELGRAA